MAGIAGDKKERRSGISRVSGRTNGLLVLLAVSSMLVGSGLRRSTITMNQLRTVTMTDDGAHNTPVVEGSSNAATETTIANAQNTPVVARSNNAAIETTNVTANAYPLLRSLGQTPLSEQGPQNEWERELFGRLDRIRERYGGVCAIVDSESRNKYVVPKKNATQQFLDSMRIPIDCDTLVMDEDIDVPDATCPKEPPPQLIPFYTLNGLIKYQASPYANQVYLNATSASPVWSARMIDKLSLRIRKRFRRNRSVATYGMQPNFFMESMKKYIPTEGARALVIGTEYPWLEAMLLELGVAHVTTLEYGTIESQHPQISTLLPSEFREQWKAGTLKPFDLVATFSSLEHPGLGRYGDALNPWGDLLALARARCATKKGGYLALAIPAGRMYDAVNFNSLRSYGPVRLPMLAANWDQLDGEDHSPDPPKHRNVAYMFQNPMED